MKQIPNDETLLSLLELAKDAEQKAKKLSEMGESFAQKWERRLKDREIEQLIVDIE